MASSPKLAGEQEKDALWGDEASEDALREGKDALTLTLSLSFFPSWPKLMLRSPAQKKIHTEGEKGDQQCVVLQVNTPPPSPDGALIQKSVVLLQRSLIKLQLLQGAFRLFIIMAT